MRILFLQHASWITPTPPLLLHCSRYLNFRLLILEAIRMGNDREEIDCETPHVESIDERDGPFNCCGGVVVFPVTQDAECDCESEFDEDES